MKTNNPRHSATTPAFTLVEMLVVISVIALLAAMLFPAFSAVKKKMTLKKVKAELAQVASAIDAYKLRKGYYPPDHVLTLPSVGVNPITNSLYFELSGATNTQVSTVPANNLFQTLDGAAKIDGSTCANIFGRGGIMNCSKATGEDGGQPAWEFLKQLKPNQYDEIATDIRLLACSVKLPDNDPNIPDINPWRYVSTGPTNNNDSYDLWVDIVIGNKTNRISNWSETPEIVP